MFDRDLSFQRRDSRNQLFNKNRFGASVVQSENMFSELPRLYASRELTATFLVSLAHNIAFVPVNKTPVVDLSQPI